MARTIRKRPHWVNTDLDLSQYAPKDQRRFCRFNAKLGRDGSLSTESFNDDYTNNTAKRFARRADRRDNNRFITLDLQAEGVLS